MNRETAAIDLCLGASAGADNCRTDSEVFGVCDNCKYLRNCNGRSDSRCRAQFPQGVVVPIRAAEDIRSYIRPLSATRVSAETLHGPTRNCFYSKPSRAAYATAAALVLRPSLVRRFAT